MEKLNLNKYEFVYLTFAFDSLLKFSIAGFRIHIGILLIVFYFTWSFIKGSIFNDLKSFILENWAIFLFMAYLILNIILKNDYPGIIVTILYYFLGIIVFFFFYQNKKFITSNSAGIFQWLLIISGLFQYLIFELTGFQLAFYDPEHYATTAGFATRLRGFFLEPNWYSIILSLNFLLLLKLLGQEIFRYRLIIWFTVIVAFFNGSYTFTGVVAIFFLYSTISDLPIISKIKLTAFSSCLLVIILVFAVRFFAQNTRETSLPINFASRSLPILKTTFFMAEQNLYEKLFGFGVGSWPYKGLEENQLGYIGYWQEYEIKPANRDSAEYQVFLLELGYIGLILFLLDFALNCWKFRKSDLTYSIASAFMFTSFFVYPIFKFAMYLVPYYILRSIVLKDTQNYKGRQNQIKFVKFYIAISPLFHSEDNNAHRKIFQRLPTQVQITKKDSGSAHALPGKYYRLVPTYVR